MVKFAKIFGGLAGLGFATGLGIWVPIGLYGYLFEPQTIKSEKPIQPRLELYVKDNQVDTLYVYELK